MRMERLFLKCLKTAVLMLCCFGLISCARCGRMQRANYYFSHHQYVQAGDQLWLLANHGNRQAQYALGYMYYYGLGTVRDHDLGRLWIDRSARHGYPPAIQAMKNIQQPEYIQYRTFEGRPPRHIPVPVSSRMVQFAPSNDISWMRQQPSDAYTLRLLNTPGKSSLKSRYANLPLNCRLAEYQYSNKGDVWSAIICGSYLTRSLAKKEQQFLQKVVPSTHPTVLPWHNVHLAMLP